MEHVNLLEVFVYLNDLIIICQILEEHEAPQMKVLDHLEANGLKLLLDKC